MSHKTESFGLSKSHVSKIIDILKAFPEVEQGAIFGSRALGTSKKGSDVDIALYGTLRDDVVTAISYQLNEETLLPYFFDLVDYQNIVNDALKEHIDRVAIIFYRKTAV